MNTPTASKGQRPTGKKGRSQWVPFEGCKPVELDVDPSEVKEVSEQVLRERQRSGPVRAVPLVP